MPLYASSMVATDEALQFHVASILFALFNKSNLTHTTFTNVKFLVNAIYSWAGQLCGLAEE